MMSNRSQFRLHWPYDIIFFGRGVNRMVLVLCEVDEVHPILLAVETELLRPLLAIIDNYLVVRTAGDDVHAIVAEIDLKYISIFQKIFVTCSGGWWSGPCCLCTASPPSWTCKEFVMSFGLKYQQKYLSSFEKYFINFYLQLNLSRGIVSWVWEVIFLSLFLISTVGQEGRITVNFSTACLILSLFRSK